MPFTLSTQHALEPGWYWIRRCEPDGPSEWEIARFVRRNGTERWEVSGSTYPKLPTRDPDASNAWKLGPRVHLETTDIIRALITRIEETDHIGAYGIGREDDCVVAARQLL